MVKNIYNWINGKQEQALSNKTFYKLSPSDGAKLYSVPRSNNNDIKKAVKPVFLIEENLIGGIKIKINDVVIDKSIYGLVDQLREALINYEDRNYAAT